MGRTWTFFGHWAAGYKSVMSPIPLSDISASFVKEEGTDATALPN